MSTSTLSAQEIATLVGGDLFVSTDASFSGINSLAEAEAHEVSFLGNEKYYNDFLQTKSGLVLAPPILKEAPEGVGIIHVENPTLAFSEIINHFAESQSSEEMGVSPKAFVSPSAHFDSDQVAILPGASIGNNVTIGNGSIIHPGAVLCDDVTVGENTIIYPNVTVREKCIIGSHVILQPGCVIGSDGFGFELVDGRHKKIPQIGNVVIEDWVEIGANSTIDRARFGKTVISEGTKIDNLVQIAHNVVLGAHNLIVAQSGIAGSTITEQFVTVGAQGGIAGHLRVGQGVVVAGQSGLAKNMSTPGYYQGTPARPIADSRKSQALVNRLPKMLDRIKALEAKIAELEQA